MAQRSNVGRQPATTMHNAAPQQMLLPLSTPHHDKPNRKQCHLRRLADLSQAIQGCHRSQANIIKKSVCG